MDIETQVEQPEDDLRQALESAFEEKPIEAEVSEVEPAENVEPVESVQEEVKLEPIAPPNALKGHVKEKWNDLPREVQEEIVRRESDIERMMTHP